jgi:hypothetical protein
MRIAPSLTSVLCILFFEIKASPLKGVRTVANLYGRALIRLLLRARPVAPTQPEFRPKLAHFQEVPFASSSSSGSGPPPGKTGA